MLTEPLYRQYKHVQIELPHQEEQYAGETMRLFSGNDEEQQDAANDDSRLDTNRVYRLDEVKIEGKSGFVSYRSGKLGIDFLIRVPRELLNESYRMVLTPQLLERDSLIRLPEVVLNGSDFRAFQEQGYEAYNDYIASIVNPKDYTTYFLDKEGISQHIQRRQQFYYGMFHKEWERRVAYERWKSMIEKRHRHFNIQKDDRSSRIRHNHFQDAKFMQIKRMIQGKDTTGVMERYMRRANRKINLVPGFHYNRQMTELSLPGKYRDFYRFGTEMPHLPALSMSEKDSVDIASNSFKFVAIAENEYKKIYQEQKFNDLVPYPYLETSKVDTLFNENYNFFYLYRYEHPYQPGTQRLRVTLNGRVDATDYSAYVLPPSDTINYVVSSLEQLIDTTLISVTHRVFRDMVHRQSCRFKFPVGKANFDLSYQDNRPQMNEVMANYVRFTRDENVVMDSVVITAYASLDGKQTTNTKLCLQRATVIKDYLATLYNGSSATRTRFRAHSHGEDVQGALRLIRERADLKNKDAILRLFAQNKDADAAENKMRWGYKTDYALIARDIYPELRRVEIAFHMCRPNMEVSEQTVTERREDYAQAIALMCAHNYAEALPILSKYGDYNTALCLITLARPVEAYGLLMQLEQTANVKYLSAIALYQVGRKTEAANHLLQACHLDADKAYRIPMDAEMKALVKEYRMAAQIEEVIGE